MEIEVVVKATEFEPDINICVTARRDLKHNLREVTGQAVALRISASDANTGTAVEFVPCFMAQYEDAVVKDLTEGIEHSIAVLTGDHEIIGDNKCRGIIDEVRERLVDTGILDPIVEFVDSCEASNTIVFWSPVPTGYYVQNADEPLPLLSMPKHPMSPIEALEALKSRGCGPHLYQKVGIDAFARQGAIQLHAHERPIEL